MVIKFNNVELAKYPSTFSVTTLDIDNSESTFRSANGTLTRDRIAVKRQIDLSWDMLLTWSEISGILQSMDDVFFDVYYPDPLTGAYATKTFYVGNRPTPIAYGKGSTVMWGGVKVTLTEK